MEVEKLPLAIKWPDRLYPVFLFVVVILLPFVSVNLLFAGLSQYGTAIGESGIYWRMIIGRQSSSTQNAWCGWAVFITLALLVIFIGNVARHRSMTKITVGSFLLLANFGCCYCSSLLNFLGNDGTTVTHVQSVNFEGILYHLAYEQSVIVPVEIYAGEFIAFRCTSLGLWCEAINRIHINGTRSTDLQQIGSLVIEQDQLFAKVGDEKVLISE